MRKAIECSASSPPRNKKFYIFVFLIYLALLVLAPIERVLPQGLHQNEWRDEEIQMLREIRQDMSPNAELYLSIGAVTQIGHSRILVGGSYRDLRGSYRSVLLISEDAGKTWRDSGVWAAGSNVCHIYCLDLKHIWFMTARGKTWTLAMTKTYPVDALTYSPAHSGTEKVSLQNG